MVYQFADAISNGLAAGKQDLPVREGDCRGCPFRNKSEPVTFEAEGERFELAVATPAIGVGDAFSAMLRWLRPG